VDEFGEVDEVGWVCAVLEAELVDGMIELEEELELAPGLIDKLDNDNEELVEVLLHDGSARPVHVSDEVWEPVEVLEVELGKDWRVVLGLVRMDAVVPVEMLLVALAVDDDELAVDIWAVVEVDDEFFSCELVEMLYEDNDCVKLLVVADWGSEPFVWLIEEQNPTEHASDGTEAVELEVIDEVLAELVGTLTEVVVLWNVLGKELVCEGPGVLVLKVVPEEEMDVDCIDDKVVAGIVCVLDNTNVWSELLPDGDVGTVEDMDGVAVVDVDDDDCALLLLDRIKEVLEEMK
jgi:hypothetical protein